MTDNKFSRLKKKKNIWESLPWKSVDVSKANLGEFEDAVFLGLEEIEDSNSYIDSISQTKSTSLEQGIKDVDSKLPERATKKLKRVSLRKQIKEIDNIEEKCSGRKNNSLAVLHEENVTSKDLREDLPWNTHNNIKFHRLLCESLVHHKFFDPTPIQASAIPVILNGGCDVVGAAETGSGKTLAFGLPIIDSILRQPSQQTPANHCPFALVLVPTRELAIQIATVLRSLCTLPTLRAFKPITVVSVVGGMSEHKQKRQLSDPRRRVDILVATPGRLCEMLFQDEVAPALTDLSCLSYLVIDEADRMLEEGHFPELERIFSLIKSHEDMSSKGINPVEAKEAAARGVDEEDVDADETSEGMDNADDICAIREDDSREVSRKQQRDFGSNLAPQTRRLTLLFSATATASSSDECTEQKSKKRKRKGRTDAGGHQVISGNLASLALCLRRILQSVAVQPRLEVVDVTLKSNPDRVANSGSDSLQIEKQTARDTIVMEPNTLSDVTAFPSKLRQEEVRVPSEDKDLMAYYFLHAVSIAYIFIFHFI